MADQNATQLKEGSDSDGNGIFAKSQPVEQIKRPQVMELPPEMKRLGIPPLKIDAPTKGDEYSKVFYHNSNQLYRKSFVIMTVKIHYYKSTLFIL